MDFKNFAMLLENFNDARNKWIKGGTNPDVVEKLISRFKELKNQKKLNEPPKNDIGYWMKKSPKELEDYLEDIASIKSKKETYIEGTAGVIKIFENDDVLIAVPKTFEASCVLAKGKTNWCTAASGGAEHMDKYTHKWGLTQYIIVFKNEKDLSKKYYAIMVNTKNIIKSIWNKANDNVFSSNRDTDPNSSYPLKKLRALGVDVEFKTLLKKAVRKTPVEIDTSNIEKLIKETLQHEKIKIYKNKYDEKTNEVLKEFLSFVLKTTKLSDEHIEDIYDSEGKKEVTEIIFNKLMKILEKNEVKLKTDPKIIKSFIFHFVNKFVHDVGARTHYFFN